MDTIQPNARVTVEYALRDDDGNILDASDADDGKPMVYVHGYGMIVPGLEAALTGLRKGMEKLIIVPPAEAFGDHDSELVFEIDRDDFTNQKDVKEGDEFIAESVDGHEIAVRVMDVRGDRVIVDANHPLAGMTLHYSVKVTDVRAASNQEIAEAAEAFDEAGYGTCSDSTHDHGHDRRRDHDDGEPLVQLGSKRRH
ncbi:MAG: peptidylprolyl isomerase [Polyangiaceae bacterium]|nr:peptidylprolyl isomerase [Polyangiaceae bacterium]